MTDSAFAFALGTGTHNSQGEWLEVYFPQPIMAPATALLGRFRTAKTTASIFR